MYDPDLVQLNKCKYKIHLKYFPKRLVVSTSGYITANTAVHRFFKAHERVKMR